MKVALASCAKIQGLALQPAWDDIREGQADVLLLLGDTTYLDRSPVADQCLRTDSVEREGLASAASVREQQ